MNRSILGSLVASICVALLAVFMVGFIPTQALAASYVFTTIEVPLPGATRTGARGINNAGQIVGEYYDNYTWHGYLRSSSGSFTTIDVPLAGVTGTLAYGINDAGQIVGTCWGASGYHGFLWSDSGDFTAIRVPDAALTEGFGINDAGQIVGLYVAKDSGSVCGYLASPAAIEVSIDVKPGSYPNSINLGSNGVIPVAILSSADFDATQVDPVTVTLAGAGVAVEGKGNNYLAHNEDINGDSRLDLVLQVITQNLDPGQFQDGSAVLTGYTYGGIPIKGCDEIVIVPPK